MEKLHLIFKMSCAKPNCTNPKIPRGKYCRTHRSKKEKKCQHDKRRRDCKHCGGCGICEHNRRRRDCKHCKGSQICEHDRQRSICKDCGGSQICEHNRRRNICKDCGGSQICEHNRIRKQCKQCGGSQICEHNRRRSDCKECGGSQICEHNRIRKQCKQCGGAGICEHGRERSKCIDCKPEIACILCKSILPSKYKPYCFRCFCYLNPQSEVATKYKLKETYIVDRIRNTFPDLKFVYNKTIDGGCSRRMPDIYLDCGTHNLVVEIDENQHSNYSCENKRIMELFQDGGSIPLVVIRFNPDTYIESEEKQIPCFSYTSSGQLKVESCFKDRFTRLSDMIERYSKEAPTKEIKEIKLYYTEDE